MAVLFVPSHVNETSDPVDNLGGILSVVLVGAVPVTRAGMASARRPSPHSIRSTPDAIVPGAREAFLQGDDWAYTAGVVAILVGAALVYFMFPRHDEEEKLLGAYHATDSRGTSASAAVPSPSLEPQEA